MPSIYDVKPRFQALLRPLADALAARGVTANQVTIAAAILSVATAAVVAALQPNRASLLALPIVLFLRMALNAIDGMLAREHGMKSPLGAILNELTDVVSDAALYLALASVAGFRPWLVVAVAFLAALSELAGVVAVQIGASRRYDGPMGKSDRAFVVGTIGFAVGLGLAPGTWTDVVLGLILALLVATVVNRCRAALREVA